MNSFHEIDLIAYHLHELSPRRERALRRALVLNPQLAAESETIAATLRAFDGKENLPMIDAVVLERNWRTLRPSLPVLPSPAKSWSWRLLIAVGAGLAVIAASVWLFSKKPASMRSSQPESARVSLAENAPSSTQPNPAQHNLVPSGPFSAHATPAMSPAWPVGPGPTPRDSILPRPFQPEPLELSPNTDTDTATGQNGASLLLPLQPEQHWTPTQPQLLASNTLPPPTVSQEPASPPTPASDSHRKHRSFAAHSHEIDVSLGVFGGFTAARSSDFTYGSGPTLSNESRTLSASPAAGLLATFHQQFRPWLGYQIATGYNHTTFSYTYGGSNSMSAFFYGGSIATSVHELSSAYVVQGPRGKRFSTFANAGAGVLAFVPAPSTQHDSYGFRPTAVASIGIDYHLSSHLDLRGEYRGIFFKSPDFRYMNGAIPVSTRYTLASEPAVSLSYRFGARERSAK